MKKNVIKMFQYPNSRNKFSEDCGGPVSNSPAGVQLNNKGLAYCLDFDNIPTISVFTLKKNGALNELITKIKLVKQNGKQAVGIYG